MIYKYFTINTVYYQKYDCHRYSHLSKGFMILILYLDKNSKLRLDCFLRFTKSKWEYKYFNLFTYKYLNNSWGFIFSSPFCFPLVQSLCLSTIWDVKGSNDPVVLCFFRCAIYLGYSMPCVFYGRLSQVLLWAGWALYIVWQIEPCIVMSQLSSIYLETICCTRVYRTRRALHTYSWPFSIDTENRFNYKYNKVRQKYIYYSSILVFCFLFCFLDKSRYCTRISTIKKSNIKPEVSQPDIFTNTKREINKQVCM